MDTPSGGHDEPIEQELSSLLSLHKAEKEALEREKKALEAQVAVLKTPLINSKRLTWHGKWLGLLAVVGWIVLTVYVITLTIAGFSNLSRFLSGIDQASIPYDPVSGQKKTGMCSEQPSRVCIEMPTEQALHDASGHVHYHTRVAFWNSTKDANIEASLKKLAHTKASVPLEVLTTRGPTNLVDLRSSMMRRIFRREHDFTCATFFGFPIDYCMLLLNGSSNIDGTEKSHRVWIDVVGNIRPTMFSYDTIITEVNIASGLCEHAGAGQSPHHTAKYFKNVCFVHKNLIGQHEERCVSGSDAAIVQQLYEMQWGMLSCCDDPGRLARLLWRMRSDMA